MKKVLFVTMAAMLPLIMSAQLAFDANAPNNYQLEKNSMKCQKSGQEYMGNLPYLGDAISPGSGQSDNTGNQGIYLKLKVYLEGPFLNGEMQTALNDQDLLPLAQPFNVPPWNWPALDAVDSIPNEEVVDWVMVDLRDAEDGPQNATFASTCGRKVGFLLKDGRIVDIDGQSALNIHTTYM